MSGSVWGSLPRPRTLQHADQENRTNEFQITRRWLYPWTAATLCLFEDYITLFNLAITERVKGHISPLEAYSLISLGMLSLRRTGQKCSSWTTCDWECWSVMKMVLQGGEKKKQKKTKNIWNAAGLQHLEHNTSMTVTINNTILSAPAT